MMKLFYENEIIETYNKYVYKESVYFNKVNEEYHKLTDKEKSRFYSMDFPRVASIIDFKEWIEKYNLKHVSSLLSTFKNDVELDYVSADYVEYKEYYDGINDLHDLNLLKKDFDFVIFNQTLEHLYNPFVSMFNLYQHIKLGGYLYTTVPTINIPHMIPFHFWGITPIGLCMLCKSVGFEICECGFWGNKEYIDYIFKNNTWPNNDVIFNEFGEIKNDPVCQAQTWILVQKR